MSDRFHQSDARVRQLVDLLGRHRLVTLFGVPGAGKTALAHAVLRTIDAPVKRITSMPDSRDELEGFSIVFMDDVHQLDIGEVRQVEHLVCTGSAQWLTTSRRRLNLGEEASFAVGSLSMPGAESLLRQFLLQRGCETTAAARHRLLGAVDRLPGVLFELARLVEIHGIEAVLQRGLALGQCSQPLLQEIERLCAPLDAALAAAGCFVDEFDALAFEHVSGLDSGTLAELVDRGYVERRATQPPCFQMLQMVQHLAPAAPRPVVVRHAEWAARVGGRADRLHLADRADELDASFDAPLCAAVARLCEGPLPPVTVVDAAIAAARRSSCSELAALLCARAKIALRHGDPTVAARYCEQASNAATDESTHIAVHSLRAQLARITAAPDDALREYEEALAHDDVPEDVLLEYAAALWESGNHDAARQATVRALERARTAGEVRREGIISSNLGVMAHHAGQLEEARALHEAALCLHIETGNRRFEGIARFDLATLDHELGIIRRALEGYRAALDVLVEVRDRRLADLTRAAIESTRAQLGEPAAWSIEALVEEFAAVGDATFTEATALYAQLIDVLGGKPAEIDPQAYVNRPDELQLPARLIADITEARAAGRLLTVSPDFDRFTLNEEVVDLGGREALKNVFGLLVQRRLTADEAVSLDEIISHGWPGEIVTDDAARNRAHVALSTLRRLGLRGILETVETRYQISTPVCIEQMSTGPTAPSS